MHGGGLDDLLIALIRSASGGATKELVFITDGDGRQFVAADSTGYFDPDLNATTQWQNWQYAGGSKSSNTFASSRLSNSNAPGLSFFRNRVYDQGTGRWTQEDPIGVAGGFNLYQFNGNNAVSFTDPFGLTPCDPPSSPKCARARIEGTVTSTDPGLMDPTLLIGGIAGAGRAIVVIARVKFPTQ